MSAANPYALGRQERFAAKTETTFGTFIKPAGTDSMKVWQAKMDMKQERVNRGDKRQGRSQVERITRRKTGTWSVEKYLIPNGAAGSKPDDHALLLNCFGTETVNASTSVVYALNDGQSALGSMTLLNEVSSVFSQIGLGCGVESFNFKFSGGNEPMLTYEGFLADLVTTGYSTLNGNVTTSATIVVQTADQDNFAIDGLVKVGSNDNSGAGYHITNKSGPTLTLETTLSASSGDAVIPFYPTETTTGHPSNLITGSVTLDGTTVHVLEGSITVKNNHKVIDDEAYSAIATDFIPGFRDVSGTLKMRARRDYVIWLAHRQAFGTHALVITNGNTAGAEAVLNLPQIEFEFAPFEIPQSEEVTFELPFVGLASSDGAHDEITLTFQ